MTLGGAGGGVVFFGVFFIPIPPVLYVTRNMPFRTLLAFIFYDLAYCSMGRARAAVVSCQNNGAGNYRRRRVAAVDAYGD